MAGLTHDDAVVRAAALEIHRYALRFDLPAAGDTFGSTSTIRFSAHVPDTFLDLAPAQLIAVTLDGVALDTTRHTGRRFPLTGLGGEHEVVVETRMAYSHDGEGLHHFVDPADDATYLCATSAVDNAPRWFACFDQPDLKAPYDVEVNCPDGWTVLGNGAATRGADGRWRLATTPPISTYHVTLVAGPWHSVLGDHAGIPLGVHARRSLAAELDRDAAGLLQLTADSLDAFHELFGVDYPFGEYHQAFVPEFNWGAMENPGCVTFRDQLIFRTRPTDDDVVARATTVIHEMAHMWFGDLVTMRWWDDLWLNESFAEYLAHRVGERITDLPVWEDFAASRKSWGYTADRRPTTHPVAGTGAVDAEAALDDFDGISYAKGASVLRQLVAYLGDDAFVAGLRRHITGHAYGNATFADLLDAWAAELDEHGPGPSPADLVRWSREWLRSAGVDVIAVAAPAAGAAPGATVLERSAPEFGPPARRPHAVTVAVVPDGGTVAVLVDGDHAVVPLVAADPSTRHQAGSTLVVPNAGDETWATVRLAPDAWDLLPDVLPRISDGRTRVVLWNALRAALDDGLVTPDLAVRTVVAALHREVDVVANPVLRWISRSVPRFVAPGAERDRLALLVSHATSALLHSATPGGSLQLTAARSWAAHTTDLAALREWEPGAQPVDGLDIDVELAWTVTGRRAELGDLDDDAIDAAAARDRTASGLVHATRCRAARPAADAKAAAWAAIVDPASTLSQYELTALAEGIWIGGQEDLAQPYVARWFAEIPGTAQFRSGWALQRIAERCFPDLAVSAATLDLVAAFTARSEVAPALRRVAADAGDDLRRAVAVRSAAVG